MNTIIKYIFSILLLFVIGCNVKYNFTGSGKINAKTFQVNYFQNNAQLVEPGIERIFTQKLQNTIVDQTNLNLVTSGGDLTFEGEIIDYRIVPNAPTADQFSGQNQMTISINVRFTNRNNPDDDFEKRFSFFYNYSSDKLPSSVLNEALDVIYTRITQDIFNESLAKW